MGGAPGNGLHSVGLQVGIGPGKGPGTEETAMGGQGARMRAFDDVVLVADQGDLALGVRPPEDEHHGGLALSQGPDDGICQLQDHEADTVIVAGMGGELVIHILEEGRRFWDQIGHWILSPQSELDKVRDYLVEQGFAIERETMLKEEGKYYVVMDVVRGQMESLKPWESLYGPLLLTEKNPVLAELLQKEKILCESILKGLAGQESESAGKRAEELRKQIRWIEEAQHEMQ